MLREALRSIRGLRLADPHAWVGRLVVWCGALLVGLSVVAFAELFELAYRAFTLLWSRWFWLPLVLTPMVSVAAVWLTMRYFPGAEGGGIPQVIAAGDDGLVGGDNGRFVSIRIAIGKVALVLLALVGGFAVGREGPSVQIGASLLHATRRLLPAGFAIDGRSLLIAGGAAGMAAALNTPLAGIIFGIEQLARRFETRTNGVLIAAIVWAGLVSLGLLGNYTYFGRLFVGETGFSIVPVLLVAGILCGLAGGLFARLLLNGIASISWLAKVQAKHPLVFAGACGLGAAVLGLATAGLSFGGGYETTRNMLAGDLTAPWYYSVARFAATLLMALSGMPGGIFAPSLAVGAGIGADLVSLAPSSTGAAAVIALCMTAYLAAVTHAPLTSFIVVMEMVDGHAMVLSLMAVAMVANLVARLVSPPLYETLAERMLAGTRMNGAGDAPGRQSRNTSP
ncbi:MAG TPA: chloride channel protein [Burkholderiaceae bacterium]|nr:chloride channel protein [Burkholderiaceae bacterium]